MGRNENLATFRGRAYLVLGNPVPPYVSRALKKYRSRIVSFPEIFSEGVGVLYKYRPRARGGMHVRVVVGFCLFALPTT